MNPLQEIEPREIAQTAVPDRLLTRLIYGGGVALTVFFLLLGWITFRIHEAARFSIEKTVRVENNLAQVLYLDMVLSGFARSSVKTKGINWERRYESVEPRLQKLLEEIFQAIPPAERKICGGKAKLRGAACGKKRSGRFCWSARGK